MVDFAAIVFTKFERENLFQDFYEKLSCSPFFHSALHQLLPLLCSVADRSHLYCAVAREEPDHCNTIQKRCITVGKIFIWLSHVLLSTVERKHKFLLFYCPSPLLMCHLLCQSSHCALVTHSAI